MMNDSPPPNAPDTDGSKPVSMVPQELAIELLHSKDAKIAAAAARVFSHPKGSPMLTASRSSPAPLPPPPPPPLPLPSAESSSTVVSNGPTGFAKSMPHCKAAASSSKETSKNSTSDSSTTAASALTAMASASTTGAALASAATASSTTVSRAPGRKFNATQRIQRSRERNRMHARKTRQRKKEHMSALQDQCAKLKTEQLRLKQAINEKNTASILLGMFGKVASTSDGSSNSSDVDPKVDALMKRAVEDIPDASKIPELPALILPGQHSSKKIREAATAAATKTAVAGSATTSTDETAKSSSLPQHAASASVPAAVNAKGHLPDDGIDYDLLSKDRSKCTPAELDQIRRERNRMHAKRTRDRKRIFMEEMEVVIKQLEGENKLLQDHLDSLNDNNAPGSSPTSSSTTPSLAPTSPRMNPSSSPMLSPPVIEEEGDGQQQQHVRTVSSFQNSREENTNKKRPLQETSSDPTQSPAPSVESNGSGITVDQIKNLLSTAGELDKNSAVAGMLTISSVASAVSAQNSEDEDEQDEHDHRAAKRQCIVPSEAAPVPASC